MYQSLLSVDLADDKLKPGLAADFPEVERTDSLTLLHYTLREEARWDNGSPVTAHDVVFTLKALQSPLVRNENLRPQLAFITDVRLHADSPLRFTFVCRGYTPEMQLLSGDFFILPAYVLDPEGAFSTLTLPEVAQTHTTQEVPAPVGAVVKRLNSLGSPHSLNLLAGSAGYTLTNWRSGQFLVLSRKADWWGNQAQQTAQYLTANPEQLNFQIIPDNTTALLALKNGQLDVLDNIPVHEFEQLRRDEDFLKNYTLHTPQGYDLIYAGLNTRMPKLRDKRTRQAIAYLLDAHTMIKVTQQDYAIPTVGPVPPKMSQYYNTSVQPYTFDPNKATTLLQKAGWQRDEKGWHRTDGGQRMDLALSLLYRAGNTMYEQMALILKQNAGKVGIPVTLQGLEGQVYTQKIDARDFDIHLRGISGNPFVFNFKPLFHTDFATSGGYNATGFGTPESDSLLDQINNTEQEADKIAYIKRLQEILHEEAAFLPIFFRIEKTAIHQRFTNTKVSGLRPYYDLSAFMLKP